MAWMYVYMMYVYVLGEIPYNGRSVTFCVCVWEREKKLWITIEKVPIINCDNIHIMYRGSWK